MSPLTKVTRALRSFRRHLRAWTRPKIKAVFTEEVPDAPEEGRVYVVGQDGEQWSVAMRCPCGCTAVIQLNLHSEGRPRWKLTCHKDGSVSLFPSVWRRVGCGSHFFLRRGRIEWFHP
jgi:hypothetical protein